jgi:hypothetical protein
MWQTAIKHTMSTGPPPSYISQADFRRANADTFVFEMNGEVELGDHDAPNKLLLAQIPAQTHERMLADRRKLRHDLRHAKYETWRECRARTKCVIYALTFFCGVACVCAFWWLAEKHGRAILEDSGTSNNLESTLRDIYWR